MAQSARDAALRLSWRRFGGDGHWCSFFDFSLDSDSLAKGGAYRGMWESFETEGRRVGAAS